MSVDPRAATGFASAVDAYERGRPSYPPQAIEDLVRELGLTRTSTVLDLAAGTGKLTAGLVPLVGRVVAVEPSPPMLATLRRRLPDVTAKAGTAEAIPLADGSVDAVFVGEAFHWFRTEETCREIARVLVPGGGLALLWNRARWDEAELPWLPAFEALLTPYRLAAGPFPADEWKAALERTGRFAPLSEAWVEDVRRDTTDGVVALVASWSWIVNLDDEERAKVLAAVRDVVGERSDLRLRYCTEIHWTRRR
jgi:ubiquinone/menaquinone biosynthesis C-methylase UbiE